MAVQTYSLSVHITEFSNMKPVKLPKFDWNKIDERNFGRTKNEWGMQYDKELSDVQIIEAYTVSWDLEKASKRSGNGEDRTKTNLIKCRTCGKEFEFFGSAFCTKKCFEDYYVAKV